MPLIEKLIKEGLLKTPSIIKAFRKIKRADFLPPEEKELAQLDEALPIGWGQTNSQPLTVAFMLELLQPQSGDKVLDIGSGSGWTSALLAQIVGEKGKVVAIEIIPQLCQFGKENVGKYSFLKKGIVRFVCGDGSKGFPQEKPFDKILVSAASPKVFPAWKEQLKEGGRIVLPMGDSLWLFQKSKGGQLQGEEYPGFVFVPLVKK